MRNTDFHYNIPLDPEDNFPTLWDCYKKPSQAKQRIYVNLRAEFLLNRNINVLDLGVWTYNTNFFTFVCDYLDLTDRTFKRTIVYPTRRVTIEYGKIDK